MVVREPSTTSPSPRRSAVSANPAVRTSRPRARATSARAAVPGSSALSTTKRPIRPTNSLEGGVIGLDRAVVVEVVGVDVGDDGPLRLVDQEGAVALVRLGDQQVALHRGGRWRRGWRPRHRSRTTARAPAASRAHVSIAVVVVLPCVPATAIVRRPAMTERSPAERGHSRSPRRSASTISGLSSRTAVDAMTVSIPSRWEASCPTWQVMPSARSAWTTADALASLPLTVTPCCAISRAMADRPAPPMPMKNTFPSSLAGGMSRGRRFSSGAASRIMAASRWSASRVTMPEAAADMAASRPGCDTSGITTLSIQAGVKRGVVDQQRSPGLHDRMGVVRLLAVADGQRDEGGRQPDGGHLGDGVGAGPAHDEIGGGVRQLHPLDERHHDVRRVAGQRGRPTPRRVARPRAAPGRRRRRGHAAAADTAWLMPAGALRAAGDQQGRDGRRRGRSGLAPRPGGRRGPGARSRGGSAARCTARGAGRCRGSSSRRAR